MAAAAQEPGRMVSAGRRKTKIVGTVGPATAGEQALRRLLEAGVDVVRLNGSHNTLAWHGEVIRRVRAMSPLTPILLDIPGRKVRTGLLARDIDLVPGREVTFTTQPGYEGTDKVPVTYPELHADLGPGNVILADDGTLRFRVVQVAQRDVRCRIETNGVLRSSKGLNLPYVRLNGPTVNERDAEMLALAAEAGVDFVGISFVESAAHVEEVRTRLGGADVGIIAKIENKFGVEELRQITLASDALMIDRGDLAAETEIEGLAIMQKRILREAHRYSKPVIVATEMLHTMIRNPQPTKAEVNDISNAVFDGAAAIMLSGETAVGDYPLEAVTLMDRVATIVEREILEFGYTSLDGEEKSIQSAIGRSIYEICRELPVTKVICLTARGFAPKMISRYRLRQPIIAVTNTNEVARKINLSWGVQPVVLDLDFTPHSADHILAALRTLYGGGLLTRDDLIAVAAVKYPRRGNKMNTVELYEVRDLVESQGWCSPSG